jgi:hypothetical protein
MNSLPPPAITEAGTTTRRAGSNFTTDFRAEQTGVSSVAMTRTIALTGRRRRRGNPNWGQPPPPLRALPTEFEILVKRLGLTKPEYVSSAELKHWCEHNRNRVYVPEWLLEEWGIEVESIFSGVA